MLLEHRAYDRHEFVAFRQDKKSGLRAYIAIHDSTLGPAIGGCRMLSYASSSDALADVLRLSRGMTYKCAIAGIPYGGGKSVIIGDPQRRKSVALLHAMGSFVDMLGGRYITSLDTGTTLEDVKTIGERTSYTGGVKEGADDPSSSTAQGIFVCVETAVRAWLDKNSVKGLRIAIQGAGNVGGRLAALLMQAGAHVWIADVNEARATAVASATGAKLSDSRGIHTLDVDVFSPCALGGTLTDDAVGDISARIVAGGANNQLAHPGVARALADSGVLYCPDYLTNAGGIIALHYQRANGTRDELERHIQSLGPTLLQIIEQAASSGVTTAEIADQLVEARLQRRM